MRPAEDILEDILQQLETIAQSGIGQNTQQDLANAIRGMNRGPAGGGRPSSTGGSGVNGLSGAIIDLGLGQLGTETTQASKGVDTLSEASLKVTAIMDNKLGRSLEFIIESLTKFYKFMDSNLDLYKNFNTQGLRVQDGMMGLYTSLAKTYISMDSLLEATSDARSAFASLGADGVRDLGNWMTALKESENSGNSFAMANEQMAKYVITNMKAQKAFNEYDKLSSEEKKQANIKYLDDLNSYSKVLGMSTDELTNKLSATASDFNAAQYQASLMAKGMSQVDAAKAAEGYNLVNSSLGRLGQDLQKQMQNYANFGYIDKDSPLMKLFSASPEMQKAMTNYSGLMRSGALATDEGRKAALELFSNNKALLRELNDPALASMWQSMPQIGQYMTDVRVELQNATKLMDNTPDAWTNGMTKFNNIIEIYSGSFKALVGKAFTDPKGALVDALTSMGRFGGDSAVQMTNFIQNLSKGTKDIITSLFGPQWEKWIIDKLSGLWDNAKLFERNPLLALEGLFGVVRNWITKTWDDITVFMDDIKTTFYDAKAAIQDVKKVVQDTKDYINWVAHPVDSSMDFVKSKVDIKSLDGIGNSIKDSFKSFFGDTDVKVIPQTPTSNYNYRNEAVVQPSFNTTSATPGTTVYAGITPFQMYLDQMQEFKKMNEYLGRLLKVANDGNRVPFDLKVN